jgi:hypothetical protein
MKWASEQIQKQEGEEGEDGVRGGQVADVLVAE